MPLSFVSDFSRFCEGGFQNTKWKRAPGREEMLVCGSQGGEKKAHPSKHTGSVTLSANHSDWLPYQSCTYLSAGEEEEFGRDLESQGRTHSYSKTKTCTLIHQPLTWM